MDWTFFRKQVPGVVFLFFCTLPVLSILYQIDVWLKNEDFQIFTVVSNTFYFHPGFLGAMIQFDDCAYFSR